MKMFSNMKQEHQQQSEKVRGSPVGVVELLDQLPPVSQADLDVGCGLGGVEVYRGAGLRLIRSLVLLGQRRN